MGLMHALHRQWLHRHTVDLRQAADILELPTDLIRRAVETGDLHAVTDSPPRFRKQDLEDYKRHLNDRRRDVSRLLSLVEEQEYGWPDTRVS